MKSELQWCTLSADMVSTELSRSRCWMFSASRRTVRTACAAGEQREDAGGGRPGSARSVQGAGKAARTQRTHTCGPADTRLLNCPGHPLLLPQLSPELLSLRGRGGPGALSLLHLLPERLDLSRERLGGGRTGPGHACVTMNCTRSSWRERRARASLGERRRDPIQRFKRRALRSASMRCCAATSSALGPAGGAGGAGEGGSGAPTGCSCCCAASWVGAGVAGGGAWSGGAPSAGG